MPLAIRIDLYAQGITNGDVGTDWKTPYNIKLMSGGTLSKKLSYYLYFFLFERGEVGGLEDAYIHYNNIGMDLRPSVSTAAAGVSFDDRDLLGVNSQTLTQSDKSVGYEGFYLGLSFTY